VEGLGAGKPVSRQSDLSMISGRSLATAWRVAYGGVGLALSRKLGVKSARNQIARAGRLARYFFSAADWARTARVVLLMALTGWPW